MESVPGEYADGTVTPPTKDTSRRYVVAIEEHRIDELRDLLRRAASTFDQKAIYLAVAGLVEFIEPVSEAGLEE